MTTHNVPEWIRKLKVGEMLLVHWHDTGNMFYCIVCESMYMDSLMVRYENDVYGLEFELYYNEYGTQWTAYEVVQKSTDSTTDHDASRLMSKL